MLELVVYSVLLSTLGRFTLSVEGFDGCEWADRFLLWVAHLAALEVVSRCSRSLVEDRVAGVLIVVDRRVNKD